MEPGNGELEEELQLVNIDGLWQQFLANLDERGRAIETELAK